MRPGAGQPGQAVLVLGQLDLELALAGAGVLGKDVQDQARAIQHLDVVAQRLFQVAQLARREFVVKDDQVSLQVVAQLDQLLDLARADEGGRVEAVQPLPGLPDHLQAGGAGQLAQFDQRVLDVPAALLALQLGADEQRPRCGLLCVNQFVCDSCTSSRIRVLPAGPWPRRMRSVAIPSEMRT